MGTLRIGRILAVVMVVLGMFGVLGYSANAQQGSGGVKERGQVAGATFSEQVAPTSLVPQGGTPTGTVIETFANSWHISTIGLTYDPVGDSVWYAHEGQASNPATIWNIDRPPPHPSIASYNLSALNPGFPVTLNDRDGAAYDPTAQTFFLTDFQGDLSVRDDNIVEINRTGTILNAWELDGTGNDSSDGSLVSSIIDIAIIPGTPNRYFVAAAEGTGLIREISLTRAGLFVPATWSTVGTCTVAGVGDVVGIDYDAARNQLAVSSFSNETVAFVNLDCTTVSQFVCDGPGAAHTGITVIPGTFPREVWLTDFSSQQTTRCTEPLINLTQTVGTDSSSCAASDTLIANGYAVATRCYSVVNLTTDITFTTHTLTDTTFGTILNEFPYTLVPGASAFITDTSLVTQSVVHTGTWSATNDDEDLAVARDRSAIAIAPPGVCTYYASSNVPLAIGPDPSVVTSTLTVADAYPLVDVNVYLTATHSWDSDLVFTLVAPDGTPITLVNQRGGNGDNFTGTVLDDHAFTTIGAGTPPFTGRFIPESALNVLNGDASNGNYRLRIQDVAAGDGGTLSAWGVELCRTPVASIGLSKTVGTTSGVCAGTDTISVAAGTTVYYCYTVTNTGEFTLPLHDLNDNELGTLFTDYLYELGPGDSVSTVDAGLTISATINNTTVNTATWSADIDGALLSTASDSATVNVLGPTATSTPTNTPTVTPTASPTLVPGVCSFDPTLNQFYFTGFESGDDGWVESGFGDWERGAVVPGVYEFCDATPQPEPAGAYSGANVFGTNLNGCYQNSNADNILSQTFDFSNRAAPIYLNLHHWYHVFETFDYAVIRVNGTQFFRTPNSSPTTNYVPQQIDLSAYAGNPSVTVEFVLHTTTVVNRMGWYIDNVELCSAPGATATPTNTPTSTTTNTPTATATATNTNTPIPPTFTATATNTNTPVPPTFTATVTNTPQPNAPEIEVNPTSLAETHDNAPEVTTGTLTIANTGDETLTWTINENNSLWNAPNPAKPRDPNAPVARQGVASGAVTSPLVLGPIVGDGSFETGTPNASWEEFSSNFGTPLCDAACGAGGGTGPRTGAWWAWFGGTTAAETGILTQTVTIPTGSATLTFWLEIPATATGTNGFLSVRMDGTELFRAEETTTGYGTYAEVSVDVSAYAGGTHDLVFFSITDAGAAVTNFFVDDVMIEVETPPGCPAPNDIPWLTLSATSGSTAGGGSTPITVTYDSTDLPDGVYNGMLCISSNDPDEGTIAVPVSLTVTRPTAIDIAAFQSGIATLPIADLTFAGFILLAGVALMLRRRT